MNIVVGVGLGPLLRASVTSFYSNGGAQVKSVLFIAELQRKLSQGTFHV